MLAWVVDMASRVVTPRATLAGTALWSSQKLIQDTETVIVHGTYTVTTKNDNWRANRRSTLGQRCQWPRQNTMEIQQKII